MDHDRPAASSDVGTLLCVLVLCAGCEHKTPPHRQRPRQPTQADGGALPTAHGGLATDDAAAAAFHESLSFDSVAMLLPQPVPEPASGDRGPAPTEAAYALPQGTQILLGSEVVRRTREPNRKGTLVNVWATWCGSCQEEMPMLLNVRQRYATRGIDVLFVSVDDPKAAANVQVTLRALGAAGPTLIADPELGQFKRALSPIWRGALPSTFLYDYQGRLRYFWGAQAMEGEVVPIIEGLLAGKPIDGLANFSVTGGTAR